MSNFKNLLSQYANDSSDDSDFELDDMSTHSDASDVSLSSSAAKEGASEPKTSPLTQSPRFRKPRQSKQRALDSIASNVAAIKEILSKKDISSSNLAEPTEEILTLDDSPISKIDDDQVDQSVSDDDDVIVLSDSSFSREDEDSKDVVMINICSICLNEGSAINNEIINCDGCGICTHEGCYGVSGPSDDSSDHSDEDTEPWFCDACLAGVTPNCELCPTIGGAMKETNSGRWVHLVCALYTSNVFFDDNENLSLVDLRSVPSARWGSKECCLCDENQSVYNRTGICINCDAGLCRQAFHVTCALKEGLLCEVEANEDLGSSYFAYCKSHCDKDRAMMLKQNFLCLQSFLRVFNPTAGLSESSLKRFRRKLARQRRSYQRSDPHKFKFSGTKAPRLLTTCPAAVKALLNKAHLLMEERQVESEDLPSTSELQSSKKSTFNHARFASDFCNYYLERNERVSKMNNQLQQLTLEQKRLKLVERSSLNKYHFLKPKIDALRKKNAKLASELTSMYTELSSVASDKFEVPAVVRRHILFQNGDTEYTSSDDDPIQKNFSIQKCDECSKSSDQHLMTRCDSCQKIYHIGCLEPPLDKVPKKTRIYGWECSECVLSSSESEDDMPLLQNVERHLRGRSLIKRKRPWSPTQDNSEVSTNRMGNKRKTM